MENIDISKIKEKNDNPQTKKLLKIYQEVIQNKSKCPPSLFNIITIIILIVLCVKFNFGVKFKKFKIFKESIIKKKINTNWGLGEPSFISPIPKLIPNPIFDYNP